MADADQQQAQAPQQLTIADLLLTAQIVQMAASRGLFKAEEFKTVGDFYERLIAFLESSGAITRNPTPVDQPAEQAPAAQEQVEEPKEKTNAKARRKA